jgi:hypothetical protein
MLKNEENTTRFKFSGLPKELEFPIILIRR